jgi:anti-anti-sigma factor
VLRITVEKTNEATVLKVEGKLAGPWVHELDLAWTNSQSKTQSGRCVVDLTEVTFVDAEGQKLLAKLHHQGAKLQASGCMNRSIVERIERDS